MFSLPLSFLNLLSNEKTDGETRLEKISGGAFTGLLAIVIMVSIGLIFAIIGNIRATFNAKANIIKS